MTRTQVSLVACTLLIIGAAVCSVGCAHRQPPPPPSTGTVYTLISVEVVDLDEQGVAP